MLKKIILTVWLLGLTNIVLASDEESFQCTFFLPMGDGSEVEITAEFPYSWYKYYNQSFSPLLFLINPNYFQRLVTPEIFNSLSQSLKIMANCYNDEDYAATVVMFVQQIPHKGQLSEHYPLKTLLENKGDCSDHSILAASILKVGGIDVVLLSYNTRFFGWHMIVGIHLPQKRPDESLSYYLYNSKRYYPAECGGRTKSNSNSRRWRIGELPEKYFSSVYIIPLS